MSPRTVAVTGASGLIGRHLCDHFRRKGWTVRALMRDDSRYPFNEPGIERYWQQLPVHIGEKAFAGADVVIHAAYATRFRGMTDARLVNEAGTAGVAGHAHSAGARYVFVSSLAARPDAESFYGRSKHWAERLANAPGDLVIRPGLVLANDGGLAHRLRQQIRRTRLIPVFGGGRQIVQTIHIDDLVAAFDRAIERELTGTLNVAEPDGMPIADLLRLFAESDGVRALSLPLPATPMLAALRLVESFSIPLPISSENLLGFLALRHVETRADLARLGITVRTARESLAALERHPERSEGSARD